MRHNRVHGSGKGCAVLNKQMDWCMQICQIPCLNYIRMIAARYGSSCSNNYTVNGGTHAQTTFKLVDEKLCTGNDLASNIDTT